MHTLSHVLEQMGATAVSAVPLPPVMVAAIMEAPSAVADDMDAMVACVMAAMLPACFITMLRASSTITLLMAPSPYSLPAHAWMRHAWRVQIICVVSI